jgi:hypothetical protein
MNKVVFFLTLFMLAACLPATESPAEEVKPIQVALWNPVQIFNESTSIHGLRLNILYGVNQDVFGVDLGLVNRNLGEFKGIQWGFVGMADGNFTGWQATFVNIVNAEMVGLQSNAIYNNAVTAKGVQLGWVNISNSFEGLQLGLFNMTDDLRGIQIGLLNVVTSREKWKYIPLVSWSF